jgi:hypothetical protein
VQLLIASAKGLRSLGFVSVLRKEGGDCRCSRERAPNPLLALTRDQDDASASVDVV